MVMGKLQCAAALSYLKTKKYKLAAFKFTEVRREGRGPCTLRTLQAHAGGGRASSAATPAAAAQVHEEMGAQYSDVVAPQDVAAMGALCSLATFTRPEMRDHLVHNIHFREYLESSPQVSPLLPRRWWCP